MSYGGPSSHAPLMLEENSQILPLIDGLPHPMSGLQSTEFNFTFNPKLAIYKKT